MLEREQEPIGFARMRDPSMRARGGSTVRIAVGLLCLMVGLGTAGCGGNGQARPLKLPGPAIQLMTAADVAKYKPGTPERALLSWWRQTQYGNLSGFLNGFSGEVRAKLQSSPKLTDVLVRFSNTIQTARPQIESVTRGALLATVFTSVEFRQAVGARRYIATTTPQAFAMVHEGEWRLVDDYFVLRFLLPSERPGS
jgi:hypothetical protein